MPMEQLPATRGPEIEMGCFDERKALREIALHFEGCDIDGDDSARFVVRTAAKALGWAVDQDEDHQITYPDRHQKP